MKNKNQGITKASKARKLKSNSTQCQTGKCAKLSKVDKVELKTVKIKSTKVKTTKVKKEQNIKESEKNEKPIASTCGIQNKKGGPISLLDSEDSCSDDSQNYNESDLCCICHEWQPKELRNIDELVITKWGQCDICSHWTHLAYCSPLGVLRLNEEFRCPHYADC